MKIVQVTMKCELPAGEKLMPALKRALGGLNRLGLQYQLKVPEFISDPVIITATGQGDRAAAALRQYGAVLSVVEQHEAGVKS